MVTEVPSHVTLLRDFANTLDVEAGSDDLASPADLARWLQEHQLLAGTARATTDELALAHRLRDGLRAAMQAHHGQDAPPQVHADVSAALPMTLDLSDEVPTLQPVASGLAGALTRLLVAVAEAVADDSWGRLKICPMDSCQWSFYDASKNQSRTWCAMRVCGNRSKTRSYRARQAGMGRPNG